MYRYHKNCRACGEPLTDKVFDLGAQPLANDFRKPGEEVSGLAPLELLLCHACKLTQLSVVVNPNLLYNEYAYVTSTSRTMFEHMETLTSDIAHAHPDVKTVMEIGSNDGRFLGHLQARLGVVVRGVDPARNLAAIANASGVKTDCALFNHEYAKNCLFQPDVIIARHVFCHIDNWIDFIAAIDDLSLPNTVVCIEVPYVSDMIKNTEFDTIYHEHTSYLSLTSIVNLLRGTNLMLWRVIRYPIHGGAVMLMLRRKDGPYTTYPIVNEMLSKESTLNHEWESFNVRAQDNILQLTRIVHGYKSQNLKTVGIGASAKSTVWINACGFTNDELAYVTDTTDYKIDCNCPGTDIPVVIEDELLRNPPDAAVLFAWNYRNEMIEKLRPLISKGMNLVIPVPFPQTIQAHNLP